MERMHLWARINGKDYPIAYGANFKDNYSDTLDSGSIILPHIPSGDIIESAKPYDDVIVHSEDWSVISSTKRFHSVYVQASGEVYRHLLIGTINSIKIFMGDGTESDNYNYTITLVSETQGLENCLMPNRTITQPQLTNDGALGTADSASKSISFWAEHYINRYGGYVKKTSDGVTWEYVSKYILDSATYEKFNKILCPEFSLGQGTLRQALTRLFSVADCIPVVHDGVISHMDLSARVGSGIENNRIPGRSWESWTMSGDEYADRLRKDYSDGLSKDATTTYIENLGFRNSSVGSMGFDDLRLEFKHPIYNIKSIYMCYYKKLADGKVVLIRQNITSLIVLDSKRNLLSLDWPTFDSTAKYTIDDLAQYKFCTLGYSIGSKEINGFGSYLEYTTNGLFNTKKTYLENILELLNSWYPYGEAFGIADYSKENDIMVSDLVSPNVQLENIPFPNMISPVVPDSNIEQIFNDLGLISTRGMAQKTVFFQCEYEGLISSAVIYSKDYHDGWVNRFDAPNGSLQIIETEGSATKEKINKLGNKVLVTKARLNYDQMPSLVKLGEYSTDSVDDSKNDLIVYIREISYDIGAINIIYYQCKDYVLKNFYTSVFAKIRPFALASYEESVKRMENRTIEILFSETQSYYQKSSKQFLYPDLGRILSFANQDSISKYKQYHSPIETKYSYLVLLRKDGSETSRYLLENQKFVSGNALCFNVEMLDNVSAGTYIKQYNPNFSDYLKNYLLSLANSSNFSRYGKDKTAFNDITGTMQDWNMLVESKDKDNPEDDGKGDAKTGYMPKIGFQIDPDNQVHSGTIDRTMADSTTESIVNTYIFPQCLMNIPLENPYLNELYYKEDGSISAEEEKKDGKEIINETFEMEPISDTPNIRFSPYMMKLSSLYGKYIKNWTEKDSGGSELDAFLGVTSNIQYATSSFDNGITTTIYRNNPTVFICVKNDVLTNQDRIDKAVVALNSKAYSFLWVSTSQAGIVASNPPNVSGIISPNKYVGIKITHINYIDKSSSPVSMSVQASIAMKQISGNSPSFTEGEYPTPSTMIVYYQSVLPSPSGYTAFLLEAFNSSDQSLAMLSASNDVAFGGYDPSDDNTNWFEKYFMNNWEAHKEYSLKIPQGCGLSFINWKSDKSPRTLYVYECGEKLSMSNENQLDYASKSLLEAEGGVDVSDSFMINNKRVTDLEYDAGLNVPVFEIIFNSYKNRIELKSPKIFDSGSLRFYYFDSYGDQRFHFVYGQNFSSANVQNADLVENGTTIMTAPYVKTISYVSAVDDRSKTVIDDRGEPIYTIINYVDNHSHSFGVWNYCVAK